MRLIDRIVGLFSRASPPMRRWTSEELARERAALEAYIGLPKDQFTLDVQMRLVEYTAQRYLPKGDYRTEAEFQRWLTLTRARLEASERGEPMPPRPSPVHTPIPPDPKFEAWLAEMKKRPGRPDRRGA